MRRMQEWFEKVFSYSPPMFHGRGVFQYTYGIVPFRKPITVVVGEPIPVEKVENPTDEQVQELHAKYLDGLKDVYNKYNDKYGDTNVKLTIA